MRVLVACEFSGIVRDAFTAMGHYAVSCDLRPTERAGRHIVGDVRDHLNDGWDLMIAHPYCTFNTLAGVRWLYHPDDTALPAQSRRRHPQYPNRMRDFEEGIAFFKALQAAPIAKQAIENSRPHQLCMDAIGRYTQAVQPWMFGHGVTKAACLWLKGLAPLKPTHTHSGITL